MACEDEKTFYILRENVAANGKVILIQTKNVFFLSFKLSHQNIQ